MRVVVFGATGNVGTALLRALLDVPQIDSIVGVARRLPDEAARRGEIEWQAVDISRDPLDVVAKADAVVDLAWQIQPSRNEALMRATNLAGTKRLVAEILRHGVRRFVYASSVGAYSPSSKRTLRTETWPTNGIRTSTYSRHKAAVEAFLDDVESAGPRLGVVRMRTSLVFQRQAASEIHRLFLGALLPWHLPRRLRLVPDLPDLVLQATHAHDVGDAYVRALLSDATGPFNIAAEPVLTPDSIAAAVGGRTFKCPDRLVRSAAALSYRARLQPTEPGWIDLATRSPIMDTTRARDELGWSERVGAADALIELLDGIGDGAGAPTPALSPRR